MKTIEYKVSYEKMISRLPGLFAYLEADDYGVVNLHRATDSLDGCWGKIVENIKIPYDLIVRNTHVITEEDVNNGYKWLDENKEEHIAQEEDINQEVETYIFCLEKDNVYTFRTIIGYYYRYRNELEEDNDFVKFIERGIGKVKVPEKYRDVATPEFLYLSNVKRLHNKLVKMDKMCEFYEDTLKDIEKDKQLCCLCERYKQLGGDNFKDYVGGLISEAETIADEYLEYAQSAQETGGMTLDFVIDLLSTYQDFGIMTPYAPIWLPYKRYYVGDKVVYNDEMYICTEENNGKWDDDYLTVVFDDTKFEKCGVDFVDIKTEEEDGETEYVKNYTEKTIQSVEDTWIDGEGLKNIAQNRDVENERVVYDYDLIQKDNDGNLLESKTITGKTDSKLVGLRRFSTYYNVDGIPERPESGVDWLFYYRKGNVVNIRTINDDLGNVSKYSKAQEGEVEASEDQLDLLAYGDVIEDITYDIENRTIKFKYRTGVRLFAEGTPTIVTDDDGNRLIKWDKFVWNNDEKIGIKYEEEYNYEEGSDLDKLIKGEFTLEGVNQTFTFDEYVNGQYDKKLPTYKFEFITMNNSFDYNKTIANQDVNIVSILTDFEVHRNDFNDFAKSDLFREDYFNGITYQPKKDIDVRIERGSTSVFDKHIAFGEIKTLEDMEQHSGKFFSMKAS